MTALPDDQLAAYLEGAFLSPEEIREVEDRLRRDPQSQRRLELLQEALPEQDLEAWLPVSPPPSLEASILERLEIEGLCEPKLNSEVHGFEAPLPTGLIEATLGRLEQEGLMRPRTLAPRFGLLRLAAAAMIAAGIGLAIGLSWDRQSPTTSSNWPRP